MLQVRHSGEAFGTFYATLSSPTTISPGNIIRFNSLWYNTGEYSSNTGIFTCPVSGVYSFSFTITTPQGNYAYVDLYVGTSVVAVGHASTNSQSGIFGHSSGNAIVSCPQYTEVFVRYNSGDSRIDGAHASMFSGFLVWG